MAAKLGDLLLKEGVITPAQLEEALKYQVIFGGKLGTNLIEMGVVEEPDIALALSRMFGVPAADVEQLMRVPAEVIQLVPREMAERYKVIPIRLEGRRLTLVMADPVNLKTVDEISFRTGCIIRPQVTTEVRLVLALEQYYGIERERRYIHAAKKVEVKKRPSAPTAAKVAAPSPPPPPAPQPVARAIPAPPAPPPAQPLPPPLAADLADLAELSDLGTKAKAPTPVGFLAAAPAEPEEPVELEEAETVADEPAAGEPATDEALAERLVEARDRDDILGAVSVCLSREFPRSALFLVRGEMAMGWRCDVGGGDRSGFEQLQIPLDEPSVLKTVAQSKSFFLGPVPRSPFNSMILQELGEEVPETALLVPLQMMGRVVAILFVAGRGIDLGERLFELQKLTAKAAMAFEILVLKNKILMM
jgi:hypothetical protein